MIGNSTYIDEPSSVKNSNIYVNAFFSMSARSTSLTSISNADIGLQSAANRSGCGCERGVVPGHPRAWAAPRLVCSSDGARFRLQGLRGRARLSSSLMLSSCPCKVHLHVFVYEVTILHLPLFLKINAFIFSIILRRHYETEKG